MNKNIFYWALYDFANSIVLMAFLFYFSQWLVIDQGRSAWWYNGALIISSLLFIVTAPKVSQYIDKTGKKIAGLRFWTLASFVLFGGVACIALFSDSLDVFATILYTLATYAYLCCFLYFTPMLNDLSRDDTRAHVSGIGQSANAIGQVAGLLITLPFATGALTLFGDPGRAQTLLPAAVIFLLCSLPLIFLYKEKALPHTSAMAHDMATPKELFRKIFSYKPLMFAFLAYFLISDTLLTFSNNFPLYLEVTYGVTDTVKALLTIGILSLSAIGAYVFGRIASKKGELPVLKKIIVLWVVLFGLVIAISNFAYVVPVFLIAGFVFGPVWALCRSLVGSLAPKGMEASVYSYYVVAERFATFIGPAIWSGVLIVVGETVAGYQVAFAALAVLLIFGRVALGKIEIGKGV